MLRAKRFHMAVLMSLSATLSCSSVFASDQVGLWLEKMERALHEESYEGVFIYMRGSRLDTIIKRSSDRIVGAIVGR